MRSSWRFLLFGLTAIGLVLATVYTMRSDDVDRVRGSLGPTPGPDSQGHVIAKRAYLEGAAAEDPQARSSALVSLSSYVGAPDAEDLVVQGAEPTAVFVKFPGAAEGEVVLVEGTIEASVAARASEIRDELGSEVAQLEDQVDSSEGESKAELAELVADTKDAIDETTDDCACVYAFALHDATLGDLLELQGASEVNLVDVPDPVSNDLRGWELTPILPKAARAQ